MRRGLCLVSTPIDSDCQTGSMSTDSVPPAFTPTYRTAARQRVHGPAGIPVVVLVLENRYGMYRGTVPVERTDPARPRARTRGTRLTITRTRIPARIPPCLAH